MEFLLRELTGKRPLLPPTMPMTAEVCTPSLLCLAGMLLHCPAGHPSVALR